MSLFGEMEESDTSFAFQLNENVGEISRKQLLEWEKELLGLYISKHPLSYLADVLKEKTTHTSVEVAEQYKPDANKSEVDKVEGAKYKDKQKVVIGGTITEAKRITTKKGEDMYGSIGVTVFPRAYEQYADKLEDGLVIIVKGVVQVRRDEVGILCDSVETVQSVEEEMNRKHYQVWLTMERSGSDELAVSNDIIKVQDMYRFIQERPGRDHYEVLLQGEGWHLRLTPEDNTMQYTNDLRERLEVLLGKGRVEAQIIDF
jgi:DNA polymerase III subunit alpha